MKGLKMPPIATSIQFQMFRRFVTSCDAWNIARNHFLHTFDAGEDSGRSSLSSPQDVTVLNSMIRTVCALLDVAFLVQAHATRGSCL